MIVKYNPDTDVTEIVNEPGMIFHTHGIADCSNREACCIHNPSNHLLRDAPLNWRADRGIMERICEHGIGHDDPDDLAYRRFIGRLADGTHGCCGCCWDNERVGDG